MTPARGRRQGFSALEMGLCFCAIAIGSFTILQCGRFATSRGRDCSCASNLKQLSLALHMYAADWGGRGPHHDPIGGTYPYVKNQQIYGCPANRKPVEQWATIPDMSFDSHSAAPETEGRATKRKVATGYEFRVGLWSDDPAGTLIVQDIAPDVHSANTFQAARLDGSIVRLPATQWRPLGAGPGATAGGPG